MARLSRAADAVGDADLASAIVRNRNNWKLLPTAAVLNVKAAFHACGQPPHAMFPEWFPKQSTRGKQQRRLAAIKSHVNFRMSCDQRCAWRRRVLCAVCYVLCAVCCVRAARVSSPSVCACHVVVRVGVCWGRGVVVALQPCGWTTGAR